MGKSSINYTDGTAHPVLLRRIMDHYINIIQEKEFTQEHIDVALWYSALVY